MDRRRIRWTACLALLFGAATGVVAENAGKPGPASTVPGPGAAGIIQPLLVVGFMGGRVHADNMIHQEAVIAQQLAARDGALVRVLTFANHAGAVPLTSVLRQLDTDGDGRLSAREKAAARIVIYGHSWGASETVHLADQLAELGIPVLLTIQVDSVQKPGQNDQLIPANVQEAMNYYQDEGLLHGRAVIHAADPSRTAILGNRRLSYRADPVDCNRFPWFARTFMKAHIEIENDPAVWNEVRSLIQARVVPGDRARADN